MTSVQDTGQGAADELKQKGEQAAERTQQKAQQAGEEAKSKLRQEVDQRSQQVAEQVESTADAIRKTGEELRKQGKVNSERGRCDSCSWTWRQSCTRRAPLPPGADGASVPPALRVAPFVGSPPGPRGHAHSVTLRCDGVSAKRRKRPVLTALASRARLEPLGSGAAIVRGSGPPWRSRGRPSACRNLHERCTRRRRMCRISTLDSHEMHG